MPIPVKRLILKRFRSVAGEVIEFDNPTFLVGQNGSGKSNIVSAFAFLADAMTSPLHAVFDRNGGIAAVRNRSAPHSHPPNVGMRVDFGKTDGLAGGLYVFEVKATPRHGFCVVREKCEIRAVDGAVCGFDRQGGRFHSSGGVDIKPSLDASSLCLPIVGGDKRFAPALQILSSMRPYAIEPAKLREMQDPDSGRVLRKDGVNAASVLHEMSRSNAGQVVEHVCEILQTIAPNTVSARSVRHGNKLTIEFTQEWGTTESPKRLKFEAFGMSDGTLRALGLLMAVYQPSPPSVLIIEEPEATIHPGALGAILDLIRAASKSVQVVVTTHSPEILDAEWVKDGHIRIVTWEEGSTHVLPLSAASRQAMRDHLMGAGELLRANALTPSTDLFGEQQKQMSLFED
ncbi:MAG TPA: AAA family ATPase [Candidatus Brocadiia bacterium]|nr:AAA family ATPase [Candidatus Brocadiia bacterium]